MAGNNFTLPKGPALGNVPTPDQYLRIKQNIDKLYQNLGTVAAMTGAQPLTPAQLFQVQQALQANSPTALNLTALPGLLLQPQDASIPVVTTLPGTAIDGQLAIYRGVIWRFTAIPRGWTKISTILLLDYEYNLRNYPAANYAPGVIFVGISTGVIFIEEDNPNPSWVPVVSETVAYPHVDRVSTGTLTTSANNNGSPATLTLGSSFRPEMAGQQISIDGNLYPIAAYVSTSVVTLGVNAGNHNNANFVFEFPSVNYPGGALFYETDRRLFYYCGDASGSATVSGNNLVWSTGVLFDPYWTSIVLNGLNFNIVSVAANRVAMTIAGPANNGNFVPFSVTRGAWYYATGIFSGNNADQPTLVDPNDDGMWFWNSDLTVMRQATRQFGAIDFAYRSGVYSAPLASIPGNLSMGGDLNFRFYASDYNHSYIWGGVAGWNFTDGSASNYMQMGGANAPYGGLWAPCDGNVTIVALPNGGTANFTTPVMANGSYPVAGPYTGNQQNATSPGWGAGAKTDDESLHTHGLNTANAVTAITFNPGNSNASLNFNTGVFTTSSVTGPGSAHNHNLGSANATFTGPGNEQRVAFSFWWRR